MKDNTQSSTPAQRTIDKKPGEQAKRTIDKKSYHHKELRPRLLELAAQLVQEEGIKGFSIRKLAAMAGVSHAAPYRHFSGKEELLAALMLEGHLRLRRALLAASEACEGSARQRLLAMGRGYLQFAAENPAYLTAMFSREAMTAVMSLIQQRDAASPTQPIVSEGQASSRHSEEIEAAESSLPESERMRKKAQALGKDAFHSEDADSFGVLEAMVRACQEEGSLDPQAPSGALSFAVWSQVHGLALLRNEGMIGLMAAERGVAEDDALDAIFGVLASWYSQARDGCA